MPDEVVEIRNALNSPGLSQAEIEAIVSRTMRRQSVIDINRSKTFSGTGGLIKALQNGDKDADRQLNRTFDWLRAVYDEDKGALRRMSNEFIKDYREPQFKGLLSEAELKVLAPAVEGTNSAGGYMAPPEFAADLARVLGEYGYARKYGRTWRMANSVLNIQFLSAKPSVSVVAENAAIPSSKPTIGRDTVTAYKIAGLVAMSNELLMDANIDIYSVYLEIFAEQFGLQEDTLFFSDQSTSGKGLLYHGNPGTGNDATIVYRKNSSTGGVLKFPQIGDAASATDIWTDVHYLLQKQNMAYIRGAKLFVPQEIWVAMLAMRDASFRYISDLDNSGISMSAGFEGEPKWYFHTYEVVPIPNGVMLTYDAANHVSAPFLVFGNLQRAWATLGLRGGFEVELLREAQLESVSLGANDLKALRMTERIANDCALPSFLTTLNCDAS